jgi:antitoxin (DNA-binding transcriptional repressor) of toxin-antitoxin stability system
MRAVGLKVLKNKLSEYVRLAQGGETILVTDRDRVVAELVPPQAGRSPAVADAVLAELMRDGDAGGTPADWTARASRNPSVRRADARPRRSAR